MFRNGAAAHLDHPPQRRAARRPAKARIRALKDPGSENADQQPKAAQNAWRSFEQHKNIMVLVGICPHWVLAPKFHGELTSPSEQWKGRLLRLPQVALPTRPTRVTAACRADQSEGAALQVRR